jgi:hypothetical protein
MPERLTQIKPVTHEAIVPGTKFRAVGSSEENALDKLGTKLADVFGLSKGVLAMEQHAKLLGTAQVSEIQKPKKSKKKTGGE